MSDASQLSLRVLQRVAEFIEALPEDQLADIANGRALLTYIPWGAPGPVVPTATARKAATRKPAQPKIDADDMLARLKAAPSRDEGRALLRDLGVTQLRVVATAAGMTSVSKTPKAELLEMIVSLTVGGRLSFSAMQDL